MEDGVATEVTGRARRSRITSFILLSKAKARITHLIDGAKARR